MPLIIYYYTLFDSSVWPVCAPRRATNFESLISETHIYGHTPLQQPQIEGGKQIHRRTTSSKRHQHALRLRQRGGYGRASADFLCTMNYFRGQRERIRLLPPHASLSGGGATQIYCELKTNLTPSRLTHTASSCPQRTRAVTQLQWSWGHEKVRDPGQPTRPARCFTSGQRRGAREACSGAARRLQGNRNGTMDKTRVQTRQFGPLLDKTELN
jgi:hypothetical protein